MGGDRVIKSVVFSSERQEMKRYHFYQNDINICNAAAFPLYDWQHG